MCPSCVAGSQIWDCCGWSGPQRCVERWVLLDRSFLQSLCSGKVRAAQSEAARLGLLRPQSLDRSGSILRNPGSHRAPTGMKIIPIFFFVFVYPKPGLADVGKTEWFKLKATGSARRTLPATLGSKKHLFSLVFCPVSLSSHRGFAGRFLSIFTHKTSLLHSRGERIIEPKEK